MVPRKSVSLVVVIIAILLVYGTVVGFSHAVSDFDHVPSSDPGVVPVPPPAPQPQPPPAPALPDPVAFLIFTYSFTVNNPFGPYATVTTFECAVHPYSEYGSMKVYEREPIFSFWSPPSIPSAAVVTDLSVNISIGGSGGQWFWSDSVDSWQYSTVITGKTGRAVIDYEGTYQALVVITAKVNGKVTVLGGKTISVVVNV